MALRQAYTVMRARVVCLLYIYMYMWGRCLQNGVHT
jgi:hypothetical protein